MLNVVELRTLLKKDNKMKNILTKSILLAIIIFGNNFALDSHDYRNIGIESVVADRDGNNFVRLAVDPGDRCKDKYIYIQTSQMWALVLTAYSQNKPINRILVQTDNTAVSVKGIGSTTYRAHLILTN